MTEEEKEQFKWIVGGIEGANPKISNGGMYFSRNTKEKKKFSLNHI
jgi:hypothetical protein